MRLARLFNHGRSCVTAGLATEGSAPAVQNHPPPEVCAPAGQNHPPPAGLRTGGAEPPAACGFAHRRGRTIRRLGVAHRRGRTTRRLGVPFETTELLIQRGQLVASMFRFFFQRSSQALIQGLAACPFGLAGTE